jgi:Glycosyltransferase family 25 (LPS biosynthesis protein)
MNALKEVRGCVAFSLFGEGAKYATGALANVAAVREHYPGWQCRIYVERGHYAKRALINAGAAVLEMEPLPGSGGMFWRFMAADDPQFTHVVVRDADSLVGARDAMLVAAWVASKKSLHVIKDHPDHRHQAVIGGAFGIATGSMSMCDEISKWPHAYRYGDDEKFLHWKVWERFRPCDDFLYHDCEGKHGGQLIPRKGPEEDHVCQRRPLVMPLPSKWKAVVLSAPKAIARREMIAKNLAEHGGFLNGNTDILIGRPAEDYDIPLDFAHRDSHPHYYAALMDHKAVWQRAIDDDLDCVFVFEDDAMFRSDFEEYLARALMCVPDDWWAIQLGGQDWTNNNRRWFEVDGVRTFPLALARVEGCCGMHGTLWSRAGLRAAADYYKPSSQVTVDWEFMEWQKRVPMFYTPARWVVEINPNTAQFGKGT